MKGVDFGDLRRLTPLSTSWGFDRGEPVDRYYISRFLSRHADDVRGVVLEVGDLLYTRRLGGEDVESAQVVDVEPTNRRATYVSDLVTGEGIPSAKFDCVICTQTLQLIYNVASAIQTLHRILRPGGVLLVTVPGITRIGSDEYPGRWFWSFTADSVGRLCATALEGTSVEMTTYGNVLAATAFLFGLAAEELTREELDHHDPDFPVTIGLRAVRGA
jgi:SAM-dependent methyltransferase